MPAFQDTNQTNKKEDIKRLAEEEEKDTMSINRREDKGRKEIVHMETEAKDEGRQMENKDSKERHKRNLIEIIRKTMNTEDDEEMKNKEEDRTKTRPKTREEKKKNDDGSQLDKRSAQNRKKQMSIISNY